MPILGQWRNPARRRCDGKAAYPRLETAEMAARRDSLRTGDYIIAYKCYDCGKWHIGHADLSQYIVRDEIERRG
jgi:hypothetical protein